MLAEGQLLTAFSLGVKTNFASKKSINTRRKKKEETLEEKYCFDEKRVETHNAHLQEMWLRKVIHCLSSR